MAKINPKIESLLQYNSAWWKMDLTDLKNIESILNIEGAKISYSNDTYTYSDIDDIVNSSGRKLRELNIRSDSLNCLACVSFLDSGITFAFHPEKSAIREELIRYLDENVIIAKGGYAFLLSLFSQVCSLASACLVFSAPLAYFKISPSEISYWILFAIYLLAIFLSVSKANAFIKQAFCGIKLVEKSKIKTQWEIWGEKAFFLLLGSGVTIATQLIIKAITQP